MGPIDEAVKPFGSKIPTVPQKSRLRQAVTTKRLKSNVFE
jgi:hypothetical protein